MKKPWFDPSALSKYGSNKTTKTRIPNALQPSSTYDCDNFISFFLVLVSECVFV